MKCNSIWQHTILTQASPSTQLCVCVCVGNIQEKEPFIQCMQMPGDVKRILLLQGISYSSASFSFQPRPMDRWKKIVGSYISRLKLQTPCIFKLDKPMLHQIHIVVTWNTSRPIFGWRGSDANQCLSSNKVVNLPASTSCVACKALYRYIIILYTFYNEKSHLKPPRNDKWP